jgi:hypothetical protein
MTVIADHGFREKESSALSSLTIEFRCGVQPKFYHRSSRAGLAAARERLSHAIFAIRGRRLLPEGSGPDPTLHFQSTISLARE